MQKPDESVLNSVSVAQILKSINIIAYLNMYDHDILLHMVPMPVVKSPGIFSLKFQGCGKSRRLILLLIVLEITWCGFGKYMNNNPCSVS